MNQDTQNKFAAILAAAQAKEAAKSKPLTQATGDKKPAPKAIAAPTPAAKPQPKPTPPAPVFKPQVKDIFPEIAEDEKPKLKSFVITAHEGEELNLEGKLFTTWETANNALKLICDQYTGPGYYKTYISIEWENGETLSDRIDIQDRKGDFWAYTENIGEYLAAHYQSLTETLSFKDTPSSSNNSPELSTVTFDDIMNVSSEKETPTTAPAPAPAKQTAAPANDIKMLEYSDLSFAVVGDTKPFKDLLKDKGGKFNRHLKCGPGWIFSKKKYFTVKTLLESLQAK